MSLEDHDVSQEAGGLNETPHELTLDIVRHSAAHLLAAAVVQLYPGAKYDVGPPIEDGFFYNFRMPDGGVLTPEDLERIQAKMDVLVDAKIPFERSVIGREEARALFSSLDQTFKLDIIDRMPSDVEQVGVYRTGEFTDLCRGPHVPHTGHLGAVKLMRVAGVYWKGKEENEQLQRVYGTAWFTQEELDGYLERLAEAERRDHRRIGRELELFHMEPSAPGMPYMLPNGMILMRELEKLWREEHEANGYVEVGTPLINESALWKTSGHWDHYKDSMFLIPESDEVTYGVKPMNCPNAMVIFNLKRRSYRELPMRLSDIDVLHRNERSGTLHGLMRVQRFSQDDAHIFISEDMLEAEFRSILAMTERLYSVFGLNYTFRMGTRPEKFLGDVETWNRAEAMLEGILDATVGKERYVIVEGDGAFYGPKLDILVDDAIGRTWQTGTVQIDFQLPRRFECSFVGPDGKEHTPVVVHRAIYGSFERFFGILIEHFTGSFPLWFSPRQVEVVPVQDDAPNVVEAVGDLVAKLKSAGIRAAANDSPGERMQARIRDCEQRHVPYVVVVGKRDVERGDGVWTVRNTRTHEQTPLSTDDLITSLGELIRNRTLD